MKTRREYLTSERNYFCQDIEAIFNDKETISGVIAGVLLSGILAFVWAFGFYLAAIGFYQRRDLKRALR